jgi:phytoene desaturase
LFYVGFDKKIENISHHALFWCGFYQHAKIFMMHHSGQKSLCFTLISLTDKTAAPEGMESGFFLVPLAPINDLRS